MVADDDQRAGQVSDLLIRLQLHAENTLKNTCRDDRAEERIPEAARDTAIILLVLRFFRIIRFLLGSALLAQFFALSVESCMKFVKYVTFRHKMITFFPYYTLLVGSCVVETPVNTR